MSVPLEFVHRLLLHPIQIVASNQYLGDKIESFTKATGIKKVVDAVSQGLNIPCGCQQRKEKLNKIFPGK